MFETVIRIGGGEDYRFLCRITIRNNCGTMRNGGNLKRRATCFVFFERVFLME